MPSTGAKTAQSHTMTKAEVVAFLGKSKRSVETYVASGRLPANYFNGKNGKTAVFDRSAVEAFKLRLEEVWEPNVKAGATQMGSPALVPRPAPAADPQALAVVLAEAVRAALPASVPRVKPWLTLAEAAEYSGLPAAWLLSEARAGSATIRAINVGTGSLQFWRFHRASLAK